MVDESVIEKLEKFIPLAPLHQPNNLLPMKTSFKPLPHVACFDTSFHHGHTDVAQHFAIPKSLYDEGVRRYGFHGLSYEYIASVIKPMPYRKVIVAHLGSGSSMCALLSGKSIESTLNFSTMDGLPMGTRPGNLDPGVIIYLMSEKGYTLKDIEKFLYKECGLKGLCGDSDMRDISNRKDKEALFAMEYFSYKVALAVGTLTPALNGLDALVFTAGIGENSPTIRNMIVSKLEWLGAKLSLERNANNEADISEKSSRIALKVIPTNEELMIATHTAEILKGDRRF